MSCGVKVAVDNAAFKFDKLYSYDVPNSLSQFARVGARVLVPFGKAAPRMGVVLELFSETADDSVSVVIRADGTTQHKTVIEVMDICARAGARYISFGTYSQ